MSLQRVQQGGEHESVGVCGCSGQQRSGAHERTGQCGPSERGRVHRQEFSVLQRRRLSRAGLHRREHESRGARGGLRE